MAFDLVLEPAQRDAPTGTKLSPRGEKPQANQEEIERKLREADERREKLERERLEKLKSETEGRIEKVREKLSAEETEQTSKHKGNCCNNFLYIWFTALSRLDFSVEGKFFASCKINRC